MVPAGLLAYQTGRKVDYRNIVGWSFGTSSRPTSGNRPKANLWSMVHGPKVQFKPLFTRFLI
jgi:hypothetical protein